MGCFIYRMADITAAQRVAAVVAEQIKDSGVTVVWLCERTGIPRSTLLRRLQGAVPFDVNELDLIASALRVDIFDLIFNAAA